MGSSNLESLCCLLAGILTPRLKQSLPKYKMPVPGPPLNRYFITPARAHPWIHAATFFTCCVCTVTHMWLYKCAPGLGFLLATSDFCFAVFAPFLFFRCVYPSIFGPSYLVFKACVQPGSENLSAFWQSGSWRCVPIFVQCWFPSVDI